MLAALAQKRELRAVVGEVVYLTVIELDGADGLRRRVQSHAGGTKPTVGGEFFVLGEPSRNG